MIGSGIGGGVYSETPALPVFQGCSISANQALTAAGMAGSGEFYDCTFEGNEADQTCSALAGEFHIERTTFLIAADGTIAKIWNKVKVPGHVEAVLADVRAL